MNQLQYLDVQGIEPDRPAIEVSDLIDQSDRTLMYGYTHDRATFHLYLKDFKFNLVIYRNSSRVPDGSIVPVVAHQSMREMYVDLCYPNKRLYPERCDFEFSSLVIRAGGTPTFTSFTVASQSDERYHGKILINGILV